jgi:hypothetical protein
MFNQLYAPPANNGNLADQALLRWLKQDDMMQQADYQIYRQYYDGQHNVPLTPRQADYLERNGVRFRFNFLQLPVRVLMQRLTVVGFDAPDPLGGRDGILWQWWNHNRMDALHKVVEKATAVDGDSYVLVEWDSERGEPRFYHEKAYDGSEGVKATYGTSTRREIAFASKRWREIDPTTGKSWRRLNIYTPTEIYKYRTDGASEYGWAAYQEDGEVWPLPWPLGVVPIVPFRHDDDGGNWGRSELEDLLAPQNALNKAVLDLVEGADKTAHQIITLTGGKAGGLTINPGQILWHERPDASFSYIPSGDIEKLIRLKNDFIVTIAQLGQVPLSYFQITGQVASAETQQADDTGLVSKAEDMSVSYGNAWEDVMIMALRMSNEFGGTNYSLDGISTHWGAFDRIDKMGQALKKAEIVTALVNAGATLEGAAREAGYGDESIALLLRGDIVEGFDQ